MKIVIHEFQEFKDSITAISELINEATIKVSKEQERLELVAMDPANVAMVIFKYPAAKCVEWDVDKDYSLSINFANFKQILKRGSSKDIFSMVYTEKQDEDQVKGLLGLRFNNNRIFNMPLIELEDKEVKLPNLVLPVQVKMPCSYFNSAVGDVDVVGESVAFIIDENKKFKLLSEGDLNKVNIEFDDEKAKEGVEAVITIKSEGKVKAKYSIEYLKKMIAGAKISERVIIEFNQDYPLSMKYIVDGGMSLQYILAPRVDND